jgi:hypothetical protein
MLHFRGLEETKISFKLLKTSQNKNEYSFRIKN